MSFRDSSAFSPLLLAYVVLGELTLLSPNLTKGVGSNSFLIPECVMV